MTVETHAGTIREIWPLLFVRDIERSLQFYRDRLGFEVVQEAQDDGKVFWCRLKRDQSSLMLQQAEPEEGKSERRGSSIVLFFLCDDADTMHADLTARGLSLPAPQTAYYGMRQVSVLDPDGYDLCFESQVDSSTG